MTPQNTENFQELLLDLLYAEDEKTLSKIFDKNYEKIMSMVRYYANRCYKYKWYQSQKECLEEYMLVRLWKRMRGLNRKQKRGGLDDNYDICKAIGFTLHMTSKDFTNTKDFVEFKFATSFSDIDKLDI